MCRVTPRLRSSLTVSRGDMMSEQYWSYTSTFHTGSAATALPLGATFRFNMRFRAAAQGGGGGGGGEGTHYAYNQYTLQSGLTTLYKHR